MIQEKVARAKQLIAKTALAGHPMFCSWSAGKDSTAVLNLVITTIRDLKESGHTVPPLIVMNADTLIENPEMAAHTQREIKNVKAYALAHGLDVRVEVSEPNLLSQWAVKVISGRNLPVFANKGSRDCTIDLKVKPLESLKKKIIKQIQGELRLPPVTCVGTRYLESSGREKRMNERGEIPDGIWLNEKSGELMLSPIADWDDAELWQYLYACSKGECDSYGDLTGLIDIYFAGTAESACVNGVEIPQCRFGCGICTVGRDRSLEAMLAKGKRYAYMQPLYDLQRFLVNTQHDLSLRQWVGRSIKEGYLAIAPDVYSPEMLANLLRYCMTIDVQEQEAAYRIGTEPRFQLISGQALIAIDALWSQQGVHQSFHALEIYQDIYINGNRYPLPQTTPGKPVKIPEARYIEVGKGWEDREGKYEFCGLRDIHLEMVNESGSTGCMGHKTMGDGRVVLDANVSESSLYIDEESVEMILGFEIDYLIDLGRRMPRSYGFKHYVQLGAINMAKSQFSSTDMILRRTSFKEFEGIFSMSLEDLLEVTESADEMRAKLAAKTRRGEVGGEYAAGEQVVTSTNRLTTAFPANSDAAPAWLLENALQEARGRKDAKHKKMFGAAVKELSEYAVEMAEVYLFGGNIETAQPEEQTVEVKPTAKVIPLPVMCEADRPPATWVQMDLLAA